MPGDRCSLAAGSDSLSLGMPWRGPRRMNRVKTSPPLASLLLQPLPLLLALLPVSLVLLLLPLELLLPSLYVLPPLDELRLTAGRGAAVAAARLSCRETACCAGLLASCQGGGVSEGARGICDCSTVLLMRIRVMYSARPFAL